MIVAAAAAHRQAEPDRERGIHAINHVLDGILFRYDAPFRVAPVVAVEARGDLLIQGGVGQQVAGDLLNG